MNIFKTTAAAVISSLVIGAAPAWSGTVDNRPVLPAAQAISSISSAPSRVADRSWLEPSAANARPKASPNCSKPGQVYGQHDVVGDPESCITQGVNLPNAVGP
jgi:hypothetical protein